MDVERKGGSNRTARSTTGGILQERKEGTDTHTESAQPDSDTGRLMAYESAIRVDCQR